MLIAWVATVRPGKVVRVMVGAAAAMYAAGTLALAIVIFLPSALTVMPAGGLSTSTLTVPPAEYVMLVKLRKFVPLIIRSPSLWS